MTEVDVEEPVRDDRIDELGVVNELWDHFDDEVKPLVKTHLKEMGAKRGRGEFFEGLLAGGEHPGRAINPAKFLKLFQKGDISRKEFLSALRISIETAGQFLPEKKLNSICDKLPAPEPSLTVSRIKGTDFNLLEAVKNIAKSIEKKQALKEGN